MKVFKEIMSYVVIILIVILIRTFIVTPVRVDGDSMNPTLKDKQILILKKFDKSINRFDVVVINYKKDKLVKRVIGLPGETIRISVTHVGSNYVSKIIVNGEVLEENYGKEPIHDAGIAANEVTLGDNEYFVLGDNRNDSSDSRFLGVFTKKDINGVTNFRLFPLKNAGKLNKQISNLLFLCYNVFKDRSTCYV